MRATSGKKKSENEELFPELKLLPSEDAEEDSVEERKKLVNETENSNKLVWEFRAYWNPRQR